MKDCKNIEHKKPCRLKTNCEYCGKSSCSPNFVYHICIKLNKKYTKLEKVIGILKRCSDTIKADSISADGKINHNKLSNNQIILDGIKELKKLGVTKSYLRDNDLVIASVIYSRYL